MATGITRSRAQMRCQRCQLLRDAKGIPGLCKSSAFTLIELLVVIVAIAILAAMRRSNETPLPCMPRGRLTPDAPLLPTSRESPTPTLHGSTAIVVQQRFQGIICVPQRKQPVRDVI